MATPKPYSINGSVSTHFKWICFNLLQMDLFQPEIWSVSTTNSWIFFNPFPMDLFQFDISMDLFQSDKIPWVSLNLIHIFIQYIHGSISTLTTTQFYIIHGSLSTLNKKQFKIKSYSTTNNNFIWILWFYWLLALLALLATGQPLTFCHFYE